MFSSSAAIMMSRMVDGFAHMMTTAMTQKKTHKKESVKCAAP